MKVSEIQLLFAYNAWANRRILEHAEKASSTLFSFLSPISNDSLRAVLVHVLGAEVLWRQRCQKNEIPTKLLSEDNLQSFGDLQNRWQEENRLMEKYLATLNDSDLAMPVLYQTTEGVEHQNILWQILVHLLNHGTQHRAEAALILTDFGLSPGDLDMILYLRDMKD